MSSNTVPRRSPRLAEKMVTQPLRRSPRLAKLKLQALEHAPQQVPETTAFVYNDAFEKDMLHTCMKLRKYYMRFVGLFEETTNTPDLCDEQKMEICFMVRLNMLAQRYPRSLLATALSVGPDTGVGHVTCTTKIST